MKKTLLFLTSFIFSLGFAQDMSQLNWDQCDKVTYVAEVDSISPGVYKLNVNLVNGSFTEVFPTGNENGFCHYGLLETEGLVTFSGDDQCVNPIDVAGNLVLEYDIMVKDTLVDTVCVNVKLKNTDDQEQYCDTTFCIPVVGYWALSVDEIDLTGIPFEEVYFDLMGRKVIAPKKNSIYIVKRIYENGYEKVEKVYYSEIE